MRPIDLSAITWRKSSYSNQDGGECLEVSDDLLANTTWRKSSYSNSEGGACIEVGDAHPTLIPVRDSKRPHGPALTFEADAWGTFITAVKSGRLAGV
ncbi:DUF397 domain-containing protein [Streptomyces sp. NPDC056149]|uniref:DUF397 domain-containing protein n=1 Tax=unclassified Streptomyces TaxID=2593676 RepID=UPI0023815F81|nr:DUF397 domain-containing protein [Streptomyces sp. WZ-12]